jgi:hypothetical protein
VGSGLAGRCAVLWSIPSIRSVPSTCSAAVEKIGARDQGVGTKKTGFGLRDEEVLSVRCEVEEKDSDR